MQRLIAPTTVKVLAGLFIFMGLFSLTAPASAHGFGERYDLPVPLWLYLVSGGTVILLSFVIMGLFSRTFTSLPNYRVMNTEPADS